MLSTGFSVERYEQMVLYASIWDGYVDFIHAFSPLITRTICIAVAWSTTEPLGPITRLGELRKRAIFCDYREPVERMDITWSQLLYCNLTENRTRSGWLVVRCEPLKVFHFFDFLHSGESHDLLYMLCGSSLLTRSARTAFSHTWIRSRGGAPSSDILSNASITICWIL